MRKFTYIDGENVTQTIDLIDGNVYYLDSKSYEGTLFLYRDNSNSKGYATDSYCSLIGFGDIVNDKHIHFDGWVCSNDEIVLLRNATEDESKLFFKRLNKEYIEFDNVEKCLVEIPFYRRGNEN